jgi:MFS family permease
MLIGSAGGLYISSILNWHYVYLCAFVVILLGPIIILQVTEPGILKRKTATSLLSSTEYLQVIKDSFRLLKIKNPKWFLIILFILLYKSSDTVPAAMSSLVLIDLSFTTTEIAGHIKAYGLLLMIMGGAIAGIIIAKVGIVKSVFICGIFQLMSPLMFAILSIMGNNILIMFLTITLQNFTSGLGGTALVIYFSILCDKQLVATQFSIISSFSSFSRILLSFLSGVAASYLDWTTFFIFNILISAMFIPIFLLIYNLTVCKKVENS